MSIYTIKQSRIIALVIIILLGTLLIISLTDLFSSILGAIVIYILFKTMFLYLCGKLKLNRALSASIIIIVSFIIIIIPFVSLSLLLVTRIAYYIEHPEIFTQLIAVIENFVGSTLRQPGMIEEALKNAGLWIVGLFPSFFDTALGLLLTISMMYFFLYFMLTRHEIFEGTLIKYLPFRAQNAEHFGLEIKNMTYSNVIGQGMIAAVQGILLAVGFWIFSIPDPVFWGLITFFLSFLPVIGSPIVFVPAGIIEISSGDTFDGFAILIWGFILVMNIDNLMRLWINKKMGDIHPVITITGVVIGIPLFGILGIVFGPLLISTFILLIKLYEAAFIESSEPEKEKIITRDELNGR